jgi:hypothetical protein
VLFPISTIQIFPKIHGDIRSSRYTTTINEPGSKLTTGVVDTGGKFIASVNDSGLQIDVVDRKFATAVNNAGGNLPTVSTANDTGGQQFAYTLNCKLSKEIY